MNKNIASRRVRFVSQRLRTRARHIILPNRSNYQKGFAALEGLLILIIIAIIGGTGYYVWHSKQQTDKTLNNTSNSSQSTAASKSTKSTAGSLTALNLANKVVTLSYDNNEWQIAKDWSGGTKICGQPVESSAKCIDSATLVLKKDGEVNSDQFQVNIGVFVKNDDKSVADWFADDVDAVEGDSPTHSYLATTPRQIYAQTADYSKDGPMEAASDEIRLSYGITSRNYGVLVNTVLFKNEHYSFTTNNDYHSYQPAVETLVKSIKITDS